MEYMYSPSKFEYHIHAHTHQFLTVSPTKHGRFYIVKIELLIVHVLPLSHYRKNLQNLSHLNCGLQIRQI